MVGRLDSILSTANRRDTPGDAGRHYLHRRGDFGPNTGRRGNRTLDLSNIRLFFHRPFGGGRPRMGNDFLRDDADIRPRVISGRRDYIRPKGLPKG